MTQVRCIFNNLTPMQAKELARWFEGQGEQYCNEWFEVHGVPSPYADVSRKGGYREILSNGDVVVHCK